MSRRAWAGTQTRTLAAVGGGADLVLERDLSEEGHTERLGRPPCAALPERIPARGAAAALVVAHVLHDAEDLWSQTRQWQAR